LFAQDFFEEALQQQATGFYEPLLFAQDFFEEAL
jgi:hypothetical protein